MQRSLRQAGLFGVIAAGIIALIWLAPTPLAAWRDLTDLLDEPITNSAAANQLVIVLATLLSWSILVWLVLAVTVVMVSALPNQLGRFAQLCSQLLVPGLARRVITTALSVSLATSAIATPGLAAPETPQGAPLVRSLDLDWPIAADNAPPTDTSTQQHLPANSPDSQPATKPTPKTDVSPPRKPSQPTPQAPAPQAQRERSKEDLGEVVVKRGDSLWLIAARYLGPQATDREISH